jgi:hypothetical protein
MKLRQLYETLLADNKVTIDFPTYEAFKSIYAQLRQLKSSLDKQFISLQGSAISDGKVVRYEIDSSHLKATRVTFYLGEPKVTRTIPYEIVSVSPAHPAIEVLEISSESPELSNGPDSTT